MVSRWDSSELVGADTMSDVVTPGYASLVSGGRIINNPMTMLSTFSTFGATDVSGVYNTRPSGGYYMTSTYTGHCKGRTSPDAFPAVAISTAASKEIAANAAFASAAGGITQLLVDLGEAHETIGMFKSVLRDAEILRQKSILYRNPKTAWREIKRDLASFKSVPAGLQAAFEKSNGYYLQYRYGWRPLMSSLVNLSEAASAATGSTVRITGRGFSAGSSEVTKGLADMYDFLGSGKPIQRSYLETYKSLTESYRTGVLCEINLSRAKRLGLSLNDVPSAAWELIPFSFVADWFVKIGDWIKAWTPTIDQKILATWCTHTEERITTLTQYGASPSQTSGSGVTLKTYSGQSGDNFVTHVERRVTRSPGLSRTALPPLDSSPLSLLHTLDSIALGYQTFGKKFRVR